ncbi:MAG: DUF2207 domain-containing protein [Candidatus Saccharibacteria bacterium]|nr:MAG: DUF2207 domain-containing protein [Candidatus Saccharibacteria bacterium]
MKRFILGLGAVLLAVIGVSGVTSPSAHAQSVDNFLISSFEADYYLGKDSEGRSTLKTVERITAEFPSYDQNHGLERAIPQRYDEHSTSLKIESIVDESGNTLKYSENNSGDMRVVRIGDANTYVHGKQTYVITYLQRDVTKFFSNTNDDEFYWDTNGTQWAQGMDLVTARIHVDKALTDKLNNNVACYRGIEGFTVQCELARDALESETLYTVTMTNLEPGENITVAVGFAPHTFAEYQPTLQEKLWAALLGFWIIAVIIGSIVAIALIVWLSVRYYRTLNRAKGRGTIIPEYLPPKDASVLVSAKVYGNETSDVTAEIIDLAVRHYVKIYQTKEKTMFAKAEYELEIIKDIADLRSEERELLTTIFGKSNTSVGSRFAMKKLRDNLTLQKSLTERRKSVRTAVRTKYGLYELAEKDARLFKKIGVITIIVGIVTLSPLVIIAAVLAFVFSATVWPLTQKGAELRDYLKGLNEYITVAEEERIKMLQSPEGAEKTGQTIDGKDAGQLVKLYERVLPYAVLFGVEKDWTKQLGAYYETAGAQPDWYSGNGTFNAVVFASAVSSFSSQSSSYSSSTSSSSGGSGGGGFSGGGGGGGGGGGW